MQNVFHMQTDPKRITNYHDDHLHYAKREIFYNPDGSIRRILLYRDNIHGIIQSEEFLQSNGVWHEYKYFNDETHTIKMYTITAPDGSEHRCDYSYRTPENPDYCSEITTKVVGCNTYHIYYYPNRYPLISQSRTTCANSNITTCCFYFDDEQNLVQLHFCSNRGGKYHQKENIPSLIEYNNDPEHTIKRIEFYNHGEYYFPDPNVPYEINYEAGVAAFPDGRREHLCLAKRADAE